MCKNVVKCAGSFNKLNINDNKYSLWLKPKQTKHAFHPDFGLCIVLQPRRRKLYINRPDTNARECETLLLLCVSVQVAGNCNQEPLQRGGCVCGHHTGRRKIRYCTQLVIKPGWIYAGN